MLASEFKAVVHETCRSLNASCEQITFEKSGAVTLWIDMPNGKTTWFSLDTWSQISRDFMVSYLEKELTNG